MFVEVFFIEFLLSLLVPILFIFFISHWVFDIFLGSIERRMSPHLQSTDQVVVGPAIRRYVSENMLVLSYFFSGTLGFSPSHLIYFIFNLYYKNISTRPLKVLFLILKLFNFKSAFY